MRPSLLPSALLGLLLNWTYTYTHSRIRIPSYGVYASSDAAFLKDNTLVRGGQVQNVLEHEPAQRTSCEHIPTGPIETTLCDYESIESVNDVLFNELHALVETPFFKYFRVDLYRECPFWNENTLCMNKDCSIATVDESQIPERWRAKALSKLELPPEDQRVTLEGCYHRDSDFCFLDDMTEGDYVDLTLNPERFTGYTGISAQRVWSAIYSENCFGQSESESELFLVPNPKSKEATTIQKMTDILPTDEDEGGQCLEKRVYYKIISGLHASISTHICHEHFNQSTGEWGPNLSCFVQRIASHPERLQYIYFNTVLLLRAVARIGPYLEAYDYCSSGTHEEDADTLARLRRVVQVAEEVGRFDETVLFRGENANVLKEEFKMHFRNVSRIMDCVGCDKCRLWGKVQTTGLGTALKILFELDEKALDPHANANLLQRTEVVALINTLHRFSESLAAVNEFRTLWKEASIEDSAKLIRDAEDAAKRTRSSHSPHAPSATPASGTLVEEIHRRLQPWIQACKDSTVGCVQVVASAMRSVAEMVGSVFRTSGKERGPGGSEL